MRNWNKLPKRSIAILLVAVLLTATFPAYVFAEPATEPEIPAEEDTENRAALLPVLEDVSGYDAPEERKTTHSTTFELEEGLLMLIDHGRDVRFKDEDGTLIDYDPALVPVTQEKSAAGADLSGYAYETKATDHMGYVPMVLSEETPLLMESEDFSITMAPVTEEGLLEVELSSAPVLTPYEAVEEKEVTAAYSGDTADYAYTSINAGFKEEIVLHEKPSFDLFETRMTFTGLTPKEAEGGGFLLLDPETEEVKAVIETPFMTDASGKSRSDAVEITLTEEETGIFIYTMTLDEEYLASPDTLYPVTVDPTVTWKGTSDMSDVYIISSTPDTNYYGSGVTVMATGNGAMGKHRTYMAIPELMDTIGGKYVDSARLTIYETAGSYAGNTVGVHPVTGSWSPSTLTWNNRPYMTNASHADAVTTGTSGHALVFDITTLARSFANGGRTYYGLGLMDGSEAYPSFSMFHSSRSSSSSYRPKLVVTYYEGPKKPALVLESNRYLKSGASLKVSWSGLDSQNLANVQYRIATLDPVTKTVTDPYYVPYTNFSSSYTANAMAGVTIPGTGSLPEGVYRVYIRGVDAGGIKGAGNSITFYVDHTAPTLTGVSMTPSSTASSPSGSLSPKITWTSSDTYLENVKVTMNGNLIHTTSKPGTITCTVSKSRFTETGTYTFKVTAYDKAGNSKSSSSMSYFVDVVKPEITGLTVSGENGYGSTGTPTLSFTLTEDHLAEAGLYLGEDLLTTYTSAGAKSYTLTSGETLTEEGSYTFTVRAEDTFGNTASKSITYYYDCEAPVFTSLSLTPVTSASSRSANRSPLLSWEVQDRFFDKLLYSMDNSTWSEAGDRKNGTFHIPSSAFAGGTGTYTIHVKVTDMAGHETADTLTYYYREATSDNDYLPTGITVAEYYGKRLIHWDPDYAADEEAAVLSLYRGDNASFTPSQSTLVAEGITGALFVDSEILPAGTYWYKVKADFTDTSKTDLVSDAVSITNTVTEGEFDNTLGGKEYLPYFDFPLPVGTGSVEESTGGFLYEQTDFTLSNGRQEYGLERYYDSRRSRTSMLGKGWLDSWHREVYTDDGDYIFSDTDGSCYRFTEDNESFTCPETKEYFFSVTEEGFEVRQKDDTVYLFDRFGRETREEEPNGLSVSFFYDELGRLSSVKSKENAAGERDLFLAYEGDSMTLSSVTLPDSSALTFTVADGSLTNVRRSLGTDHIDYGYSYSEGSLTEILDGEENPYGITYANGKVSTLTWPNGETAAFAYGTGETSVTGKTPDEVTMYTESVTWDSEGRTLTKTDRSGNTETTTYDTNEPYLPSQVTGTIAYEVLDQDGTVSFVTENVVLRSFTYNSNADVTEETFDDLVTEYTYGEGEEEYLIQTETMEEGSEVVGDTVYDYDENGNIILENDLLHDSVTETVYENGNPVEETVTESGRCETIIVRYDDQGSPISIIAEAGDQESDTAATYDLMGQILTDYSRGTTIVYSYDYLGRVTGTAVTTEGLTGTLVTARSYDGNGSLISETDERGVTTTYTYDSMNRLASRSVTGGETEYTVYGYSGGSRTETVTDSSNTVLRSIVKDAADRTVTEVERGITTSFVYDSTGNEVVAVTGAGTSLETASVKVYDAKGRIVQWIENAEVTGGIWSAGTDSVITSTTYSDSGKVLSETNEEGETIWYGYDEEGRITGIGLTDGDWDRTVSYGEDGSVTVTEANGKTATETVNAAGLTAEIRDAGTDGSEIVTSYDYDAHGNLVRTTYGDGAYVTCAFDAKNRKTGEFRYTAEETLESEVLYTYSLYGGLIRTECRDGNGDTYYLEEATYDSFGRQTSSSVSIDGGTAKVFGYTYDLKGDLVSVEYPSGSDISEVVYSYDPYGRLLSAEADGTEFRSVSYDALGRVGAALESGRTVEYFYDDLGNLTGKTYGEGTEDIYSLTYSYDRAGRITQRREVSSLLANAPKDETRAYTYGDYGRLMSSEITDNIGEVTIGYANYLYDNAGNRVSEETEDGTTFYTYNALGQLLESRSPSEITEYSYSGRGDLICAALDTGMERNYTYSVAGELLTVTSTGTVTSTLQENMYDTNGTRIRRAEADGDHDYYYANGALALIEGATSDTAFLLAENAPHGMVQGSDTYQYLTDLQGSVMAVMGDSNAAAVYSYTDFGETTEQVLETGFENELCYTGAVYDRVTSLYYLNARYYDPATANFLSQDTYRGEREDYEQWNLYAYCANDPINHYDPSGHWVMSAGLEICAAFYAGIYSGLWVNLDQNGKFNVTGTAGVTIKTGKGVSTGVYFASYAGYTSVDQLNGFGISAGVTWSFGLYSIAGGVSISVGKQAAYSLFAAGGRGLSGTSILPEFEVRGGYTVAMRLFDTKKIQNGSASTIRCGKLTINIIGKKNSIEIKGNGKKLKNRTVAIMLDKKRKPTRYKIT